MKKSQIMALLLAVLMTSASCGGGAVKQPDATSDDSDSTTSSPETEKPAPNLEAIDCGGEAFRVLTRKTDGYVRQSDDISAEEINGNTLNDNTYERNRIIEDKYNLKFEIKNDVGDIGSLIRTTVSAGDDSYDLIINGISGSISLSAEGMLLKLDDLPDVDFDMPWWNKTIMDDMSVYDKHYVGINDMSVNAYFAAGIVYFNKSLAEDYKLENPYDLVREGKWTFDKMVELCRDVSKDLDGNGVFDEKDQYGITYNNFAWQLMYYGIGEPFIKKNNDGSLFFDSSNTKIIDYLQKMLPSAQDETVTLYSENYSRLGGNYRIDVCTKAFNEGRSMFWLEAMYGVPSLRDMGNDFGILPIPKYDENQENYSAFIHTIHGSSLVVPITLPKDRMTLVGRVMEDMAYYSSELVRPAFIDTTLKGKYARDNDSADMIDIVISNIRTDYALILNSYGLSIDKDMRSALDNGSTNVASLFAEKKDSWDAILKDYCEKFKD